MAAITNAQKAQVLIDGEVEEDAVLDTTDPTIASIVDGYIVGNVPGSVTIIASHGGRSGTLEVSVSNAPLVVTLGTPEPK